MNIDNFCNLGAALQNKQIEVGKQPQVYFYRSNEDSIYEMLSEGYFNALNLRVAKDDLILLYSPKDEQKVFAKVVSNSGGIVQIIEMSEDDFQNDEMPIPSVEYLNKIVQYTGETTTEAPIYINGFFYKCVENSGVYSWENIVVQDSYLKDESDDRFVHKTGDETISDIKTFTGISSQDPLENHIIIQNLKDNFRYSDGTKNYHISFRDKNNKECGYMGYNHTDKSSFIELGARKTPLGNLVSVLEVGFDDDGNKYTYAPEPTEDTVDSHQLDTVGVRNKKLESYQEKETALNYNNISNCITYIPQDIKVEASTLKAGSKAYIPNGVGVFDTVILPSDITISASGNYTRMLFLTSNGSIDFISIDKLYSGATAPTGFTGTAYWYDTTNNVIKTTTDSGNTWNIPSSKKSLPIALFTTTNGVITSIETLNGFGQIGSTIYALPGVKGLIPNGRNADGSLKNSEFTYTEVRTYTVSGTNTYYIKCGANNYLNAFSMGTYYDEKKNRVIYNNIEQNQAMCGIFSFVNDQITSFTPKQVFHALDFNDTEFIGHQAMPSDRYIDLTLLASDNYYTAPADGYFTLNKISNGANQYVNMYVSPANSDAKLLAMTKFTSTSGATLASSLPIRKGQRCYISYTAGGTLNYFRFIYAEGSK